MSRRPPVPLPGTTIDPMYPDSDGRSTGATEFHTSARLALLDMLSRHYADVPDVYLTSNLMFYYREGDRRCRCAPDLLVAKRTAGKHKRRSFRVWEEKSIPCVLFEIAQENSWYADRYEKPALYASIGVREYFVFDPEGCYLNPPLCGFRTVKGKPVELKWASDGLSSKQLGLLLQTEQDGLRLTDLKTGKRLLTTLEFIEHCERRRVDCQQPAELHARIANLEREVRRLRALVTGRLGAQQ